MVVPSETQVHCQLSSLSVNLHQYEATWTWFAIESVNFRTLSAKCSQTSWFREVAGEIVAHPISGSIEKLLVV